MAGSTDVAQTIERRLSELEAQLLNYDELARERERLQRALNELRSDDGARPGRASTNRSAGERAGAGRRRGARRARHGANIDAITGYVAAHPGATAAEIATGTGIARGIIYSATSRLAASGRLRRVSKGERQVGYEPSGDDADTCAAAPEPGRHQAAAPAHDDVGSRAQLQTTARGDAARAPVSTSRPAAKQARTATRTGAPTARGTAKRAATDAGTPAGGEKRATGGGRGAAGRRGADARTRAPRGANRAAVLGVIGERPGVSARELAAASGVGRGTLYALLRTLIQGSEIDTQQLPSGHTGYSLAATKPTAASSPAPSTSSDTPTHRATTPTPAAGRPQRHAEPSSTSGDDISAPKARSGKKSPEDAADSQ